MQPPLWHIAEVLDELQVARSTFDTWRMLGSAPACIRYPNGQLRVRQSAPGRQMISPPAAYAHARGCFRRWWQVLGSNQRRLRRRFYRPFDLVDTDDR